MDNMFLVDCVGYAQMSLTESVNGICKFQGKFQEADAVNKNKRLYTREILESNVAGLMEVIDSRGLYGELDHPTDSIIHLANASHLITKLWWEGNILMGEGEVLNTPSGKCLRSLIEHGGRVGISSRGVGNGQVNNEGVLVIGGGDSKNYRLISFDAVADPSTFSAFQTKVTGKKESYAPTPIVQPEKKNTIKAESLTAFTGSLIQEMVSKKRLEIKGR